MKTNEFISESWIEEALNAPEQNYKAKDLEDFCKKVLDEIDGVVPECVECFLVGDILMKHPHWEKKIGDGYDHIEVRRGLYGKKGFFIVRSDGSSIDISYRKAIYSYPSKRAEVMKACRTAISPIIEMFRNQIVLPFKCPITGEIVTNISDVHIDHYDKTFKDLFDVWMKDKNVDELYDKIVRSKDDSGEVRFSDPYITMDFYQFHNSNTHLRPVSKTANEKVLRC